MIEVFPVPWRAVNFVQGQYNSVFKYPTISYLGAAISKVRC